jgi:mono/diheme cytochrome c family protein
VTNFVDGTVTIYNQALVRLDTVDLNPALASSGLLGTVAARRGLAHPRAIVVTNNGDRNDADETVYVTEFFAQRDPTVMIGNDGANSDITHQGVVYRFGLGAGHPVGGIIRIPPVANTGFQDSRGQNAGCFPNQLFAMKINNNRVFISASCESPRGPTGPAGMAPMIDTRNFKTQMFSIIAQIDTRTNMVIPANTVVLQRRFEDLFTANMVPAGEQRQPLIPIDISFAPMTNIAYVVGYGASAVFRARFNDDGTLNEVGSSTAPVIRLNANAATQGLDPYGIAIVNNPARSAALVVNEFTRNVNILSLETQTVVGAVESTANANTDVRRGRHFFVTGLGRWSLGGQAWNSCEACHPNGLTDNVTWYFPRGPRQTISLESMHSHRSPGSQRILNWTAIFDEGSDFELNTRGNSGGVGALVHAISMPPVAADRIAFDTAGGTAPTGVPTPQQGLNGSVRGLLSPTGFMGTRAVIPDWTDLEVYMRGIRAPRRVSGLNAADVAAGRLLFETGNCAGCHSGEQWTISRVFYTPGEANNSAMGNLRTRSWTLPMGFPAARAPTPGTFRPPADRAGAHDQITCALRNVGTMPPAGVVETVGVLRQDQVELRQDMMTRGQGDATPQETGFNPPGLLGVNVGGPYLHAGNARTLEELFSTTFQTHYQAFSSNFLATTGATRDQQVRQLVAFLLSIDENTMVFSNAQAQLRLGFDPDICGSQRPLLP